MSKKIWTAVTIALGSMVIYVALFLPVQSWQSGTADVSTTVSEVQNNTQAHTAPLSQPTLAGAYLAARSAAANGDIYDAADYFLQAHEASPENVLITERALLYAIMAGKMSHAIDVAKELQEVEPDSRIARLMLITEAIKKENYAYVLTDLDTHEERDHSLNTVLVDLLRAWTLVGQNMVAQAHEALQVEDSQSRFFLLRAYHAGLISSLMEDDKEALEFYDQLTPETVGEGNLPLRVVLAWGGALERLDQQDTARRLYEEHFASVGARAFLEQAQTRLETQEEAPVVLIRSVQGGTAETFLGLASALSEQNNNELALIYAQLAAYLTPEVDSIQLLLGDLLEGMRQFISAADAYDRVAERSPLYRSAQVGRASAINQAEEMPERSLKIIAQLTQKFPEDPNVLVAQGDLLRHAEKFEQAAKAYTQAINVIENIDETYWALFYTRGMSYERSGEWDLAERDLQRALELQPEHPLVLNYLGYSWMERNKNLEEALEMVKKAVELRPNDGYITDSLGWGLYKLGRYEEAVKYLRKAVQLRAVDPIITDHYGDALWRSGRKSEARFQWRRVISFEVDAEKKSRIKDKLENGLPDKKE